MPYGALGEWTVVAKGAYAPIAEGIDPAVATVLATAITGMSIRTAAAFVPGETVLVQGATGVAGRLAVKVAALLGAGRIVATGRDDEQLREVRALGTGTVINTAVPDDELAVEVEEVSLSDIETAWQRTDLRGRRLVVVP
jgi:NADPH:quinone reductase-like Zn-dependent oxidoreductase